MKAFDLRLVGIVFQKLNFRQYVLLDVLLIGFLSDFFD
jgi:hypothetical protein